MREFGISEGEIEAAVPARPRREPPAAVFEIWKENWKTLQFFLRLRGQWSVVGGGLGGLVYQGVRLEAIAALLELAGVPKRKREAVVEDLLAMSDAAADVMNRRGARA